MLAMLDRVYSSTVIDLKSGQRRSQAQPDI